MTIPPRPGGFRRRPAVWTLALLALCAGLYVAWLGNPLVAREQELRVILTARDMARGGSWLVPHYQGEPRLHKPPLMYWLGCVGTFGWSAPRPQSARCTWPACPRPSAARRWSC